MENTYQSWLWEKLGERCVKNLKKHDFDANLVSTPEEAKALILGMITDYDTFGFGGSDTTRSLGIMEVLKADGKTVHDHWQKDLPKRYQAG